jgi:hypothetical protein
MPSIESQKKFDDLQMPHSTTSDLPDDIAICEPAPTSISENREKSQRIHQTFSVDDEILRLIGFFQLKKSTGPQIPKKRLSPEGKANPVQLPAPIRFQRSTGKQLVAIEK